MNLTSVLVGVLVVGFGAFNSVRYLARRKENARVESKDIGLPGRIVFYALLPVLIGGTFIWVGLLGISLF